MPRDEIEAALSKLHAERGKELRKAIDLIRQSDRDELLFLLIHQTHLVAVIAQWQNEGMVLELTALSSLTEDSYAYATQLVYKFGSARPHVAVDSNDYQLLVEICRFINNNFELEQFVRHRPFQRSGERGERFRVDLKAGMADPVAKKLTDYGSRHNCDMALRYADRVDLAALIRDLFPPNFDAEFLNLFGLTTVEVSNFYTALQSKIAENIIDATKSMPTLEGDRIDATSPEGLRAARYCYTLDYDKFLSQFGSRKSAYRKFFMALSLNREHVDENELRYFGIWRRPLLRLDRSTFTVSPELFGPSIQIGLHYRLLESSLTCDSYQAKRAGQFQARVERVLESLGMRIVGRNILAKLGKQEIGDVDILADDKERYYNVECKGVSLPLQVYFHDMEYIRDVHLPYLQKTKGWEPKVLARERWLEANRTALSLTPGKAIASLILTDSPEVLSHFSPTLCLSVREFPLWYGEVEKQSRFIHFDEFQTEVLDKQVWTSTAQSRKALADYYEIQFE